MEEVNTLGELNAKIDLRIEGDSKSGYYIEYKIGNGIWRKRKGDNYNTYAGAAANAMQLRQRVKDGLTRSIKIVLGIEDEEN